MRTVSLHGKNFQLEGVLPAIGRPVPDVTLMNGALEPVVLSSFRGQRQVLLTLPSLDTPVCDRETRHFHQALARHPSIAIIVVSMDLPFAQKRWCGAAGIDTLHLLSDFKDHALGRLFGVRIHELGLLARAIFIIDAQGLLTYRHIVPVLSDEPVYRDVLQHLAVPV